MKTNWQQQVIDAVPQHTYLNPMDWGRKGEQARDYVLKDLAAIALYVDGGHHKQWYLEQILEAIDVDLQELAAEMEAQGGYKWEEGIAP